MRETMPQSQRKGKDEPDAAHVSDAIDGHET
jgi:hypothetical protein